MAAISKLFYRASETNADFQTLKALAIICGTGLLVSLLAASYGLDLSPGFF
jgi:hypothetical protein